MSKRPRISLCIPTWNRGRYLQDALGSGLREAASLPPGLVEVLVCDNASSDNTPSLIAGIKKAHPELRDFRNEENLGFDQNYLRCVEEARGEFVWVMGDDDVWLQGSVSRVLRELQKGADACLCLAEACDLDLNPVTVIPWYLGEDLPKVWQLRKRDDLIRYFNSCQRNAGAFGFISVSIFKRDPFLEDKAILQRSLGSGYVHVWGMMAALSSGPMQLHYIPEILVRNRMNLDATNGGDNHFHRLMLDLRAWSAIGDAFFKEDPELDRAFSAVVGRNQHNTMLPGLRRLAPSEAAWREAEPFLLRAGFSPVRIAASEFTFRHFQEDRHPFPTLNPSSLCLVDLGILARGARHVAVLALTLQGLLEGSAVLAAFRAEGRCDRLRLYISLECAGLLDAFQVRSVDLKRYGAEVAYREAIAQDIVDFAPELVVNLDRNRGIESDYLVAAALPAGSIAYEHPARVQDEALIASTNSSYTCLVSREAGLDAGPEAMSEALGMMATPADLWPSPATQQEARAMFENLGWDPQHTLAIILDHPSVLEGPTFLPSLATAMDGNWTIVGIGVKSTQPLLETVLEPWGNLAVNLAGKLGLAPMAAVLKLCERFLGGTLLLQSMAKACGCAPILQGEEAVEP